MSTADDFAVFRRVAGRELDKLREENAALKTALHDLPTCRCGLSTTEQCALSVENASLRKDKERLDWMQEIKLTILHHDGKVFGRGVNPPCTRTAIDAAMGEGKQ